MTTPQILWPAPALPAFLEAGQTEIVLLVGHNGATSEELRQWAHQLRAVDHDGVSVPLAPTAIDMDLTAAWSQPARKLCRLASAPTIAAIQLNLTAAMPPLRSRTVRVMSIAAGERILRTNSLCVVAAGRDLRIAFASDLHIAAMWDRVASAIERHVPELTAIALHPQRLLQRFVEQTNQLAAQGDLDLVVLGGDLVDHVFVHTRREVEAGERATNHDLLLKLLEPLRVPVLAIPGNHDFRLYPWRPGAYGLDAIGLDGPQHHRLLQAAGWSSWLPLLPSDVDALRTELSDLELLTHHRARLAPATDFHVDMRGVRLIFANSGRDIVPHWRRVESARLPLLVRSLPGSWIDPDSEGLHDDQLKSVADALAGARAAAVFVHAPLLHPRPRRNRAPFSLDPGDHDGPAARIGFERRLFATRHRNGVLFRNPGELIRALVSSPGPVTLFTGHVHKATAVSVNRRSLNAHLANFTAPEDPDGTISLLTAPSLGHRRNAFGEPPGYILATLSDGRLTHLERKTL